MVTKKDPIYSTKAASSYAKRGLELGKLVDEKNQQYGDSFHRSQEVLKILFPDGVEPKDYKNLLAVTRIVDKLFRIANGNQGNENAWDDIAGYGIVAGKEEKV